MKMLIICFLMVGLYIDIHLIRVYRRVSTVLASISPCFPLVVQMARMTNQDRWSVFNHCMAITPLVPKCAPGCIAALRSHSTTSLLGCCVGVVTSVTLAGSPCSNWKWNMVILVLPWCLWVLIQFCIWQQIAASCICDFTGALGNRSASHSSLYPCCLL